MKANKKFVEEEEAVSAVIGVILMVAITVAIAATVYLYISGLGGSSVTAPTVTLRIVDGSATASSGVIADNGECYRLEHGGGDVITFSDLKIQYRDTGTSTWTTLEVAEAVGEDDFDYAAALTTMSVGDSLSILADHAAGTPEGNYDWRVIHNPSQSIIYGSTTVLLI